MHWADQSETWIRPGVLLNHGNWQATVCWVSVPGVMRQVRLSNMPGGLEEHRLKGVHGDAIVGPMAGWVRVVVAPPVSRIPPIRPHRIPAHQHLLRPSLSVRCGKPYQRTDASRCPNLTCAGCVGNLAHPPTSCRCSLNVYLKEEVGSFSGCVAGCSHGHQCCNVVSRIEQDGG